MVDSTIRPATVSDVRSTLELWVAAGAEVTHTDNERSLRQLIAHDPDSLLLADHSGSPVGSVIAAWDGWRGSIYRLVVAPEHRRQGLGRRLLIAAESRLQKVGAERCQAVVVETDSLAVSFWGPAVGAFR